MCRIAEWQHHFDDNQSPSGVHRLADVAKDRKTLVFTPIMDDM